MFACSTVLRAPLDRWLKYENKGVCTRWLDDIFAFEGACELSRVLALAAVRVLSLVVPLIVARRDEHLIQLVVALPCLFATRQLSLAGV